MKINEFYLDEDQTRVIYDDSKYLLVIAGAGAGKTLTIMAKIKYLKEILNVSLNDILVISFTNETVNSLKYKLKTNFNYELDIKTFHKLALDIIGNNYYIVKENYLEEITNFFLTELIYSNHYLIKCILKYEQIFYTKYNYLKKYKLFLKSKKYNKLFKTIVTFINLYKSNNIDIINFKSYFKLKKDYNILIIIYSILIFYNSELNASNLIDFNDMLSLAITNIDNTNIKYKYIIVDEYQDTSIIRYKLLKKLVDKTKAKLLVVGDDYQSIYRFSGCNLNVFLNFKNYYNKAKILYLNNTYRNSKEIINIASKFIMKNNNQIKKELNSFTSINKPLKFVYYKSIKKDLTKLIMEVKSKGNVLILARNNFDINKYLDFNIFKIDREGNIYLNNKFIKVRFLTVHKAKGLEADNVILINLTNSLYGFPNKLEDERIFKYVNNYKDNIRYEEERRLFYVALTRTKNNIYFYLDISNISTFVKEIKRENKKYIECIKK